jgi:hypothetical protein
VSKKRDLKMGGIDTTTTIHQLIFDRSDGLRRANVAILGLVEYEEFAHQKKSLREDAAQLREFRGEILADVLARVYRPQLIEAGFPLSKILS